VAEARLARRDHGGRREDEVVAGAASSSGFVGAASSSGFVVRIRVRARARRQRRDSRPELVGGATRATERRRH
jgi:hypothetical protein